jgi:plasmid stability protein
MTITVDIRPEVQAALAGQAAAHGRAIEAYVASLLEAAAHVRPAQETSTGAAEPDNLFDLFAPVRGLLTDEEVDVMFRRNPSTARPVDLT